MSSEGFYAAPEGGARCFTELLASNESTYRQTFLLTFCLFLL